MTASFETLLFPLQSGTIVPKGRTLVMGAFPHPYLRVLTPDVWQPFKPLADGLAGLNRLGHIPSDPLYDLVLVDIPKQVDEAKFWMASALYALKPDGILVLAAANDANGNRLSKWVRDLGLAGDSDSRNKSRIVVTHRPEALSPLVSEWFDNGKKQKVETGDGYSFLSQPGVFGWNKIDDGSRLLSQKIPSGLGGIGADFGAGTGYLSARILLSCPDVKTLYVAEADARALECARENLENVRQDRTLEFLWADLTKPAALPALDFIVMNPPFHHGKKTDPHIGLSFIATAAHHLKKNGKLYVVANAHLPYEQSLRSAFSSVRLLAEEQGFKIYEAQR